MENTPPFRKGDILITKNRRPLQPRFFKNVPSFLIIDRVTDDGFVYFEEMLTEPFAAALFELPTYPYFRIGDHVQTISGDKISVPYGGMIPNPLIVHAFWQKNGQWKVCFDGITHVEYDAALFELAGNQPPFKPGERVRSRSGGRVVTNTNTTGITNGIVKKCHLTESFCGKYWQVLIDELGSYVPADWFVLDDSTMPMPNVQVVSDMPADEVIMTNGRDSVRFKEIQRIEWTPEKIMEFYVYAAGLGTPISKDHIKKAFDEYVKKQVVTDFINEHRPSKPVTPPFEWTPERVMGFALFATRKENGLRPLGELYAAYARCHSQEPELKRYWDEMIEKLNIPIPVPLSYRLLATPKDGTVSSIEMGVDLKTTIAEILETISPLGNPIEILLTSYTPEK